MNILLPIAGRGERFKEGGFNVPKPLINVGGTPMIEMAIKSLGISGNFIFVIYKYENEIFNKTLINILNRIVVNPTIIQIDYITEGPASSALLAEKYINNDEELLILNCDQIMKWDHKNFQNFINDKKSFFDGIVVTYDSNTIKNSYIKLDNNGLGIELSEKKVISDFSLNGIHYWTKGLYFVESVKEMINKNIRVNNEFYISLTYNQMINKGMKITNYHINKHEHCAVGTPEDLEIFLKNDNKKN
jgi:NDP-sugar pyrophosphorylase family protein